jgi:hypothetical protein
MLFLILRVANNHRLDLGVRKGWAGHPEPADSRRDRKRGALGQSSTLPFSGSAWVYAAQAIQRGYKVFFETYLDPFYRAAK